ncbi:hypothetical protein BLOT_005412 [Blomia tropicalis]|nr:hypothetical protein BLOT_005412 [Blomia tropicalis]
MNISIFSFGSMNQSFTYLLANFILLSSLMMMVNGQNHIRPGHYQKYALSSRCTSADREAINRCEDEAKRDWAVRDIDYYTPTRRFCCFAWDTLSCELQIAQRCDPNYAAELSYITEQNYASFCDYHSRRSASCALRWWSVMLIVVALLLIIGIIIFIIYRRRQSKFTCDYETVVRPS